jgi:hypothetical protein
MTKEILRTKLTACLVGTGVAVAGVATVYRFDLRSGSDTHIGRHRAAKVVWEALGPEAFSADIEITLNGTPLERDVLDVALEPKFVHRV